MNEIEPRTGPVQEADLVLVPKVSAQAAGLAYLERAAPEPRCCYGTKGHDERDPHEYAAPEQARDTGGLREAAAEYQDAAAPFLYGYPMTDDERQYGWEHLREATIALRAALSQGAAHEEQGLDVERLARAITRFRNSPEGAIELSGNSTAAFIAAEYTAHEKRGLDGDMPDSLTVNGHKFIHVAACPCPRIQAEVARLATPEAAPDE